MKFTIDTKDLISVMDISIRYIAKNSTLPILQNVYIQVENNVLIIRATDMEKYIQSKISVENSQDGTITVDAKTLFDIIRSIESGTVDITVDSGQDTLTLKTAQDKFTIKGISSNEYVAIPEIQAKQKISIPAIDLFQGIEKVSYAVIEKNFSPVFTGVYIRIDTKTEDKQLVFVGTDSFILNEYRIPCTLGDDEVFAIIVPKQAANDFHYIAGLAKDIDGSAEVVLSISSNLVGMEATIGNMTVFTTSILIQGNFPDYTNEKIMPKNFTATCKIHAQSLDKEIKKIGILTRDIKYFVGCKAIGNTLELTTGQTDKGDAQISLPMIKEGDDFSFSINGKYISEYIRSMDGDTITLRVLDSVAPITLIDDANDKHTCIIRPVQI